MTETLSLSIAEAKEILRTGKTEQGHLAIPRDVLSNGKAVFEIVDPATVDRPSSVAVWIAAIRAYSLSATVIPAVAVLAAGFSMGWEVQPIGATLAIFGLIFLQIAINLLNDYEDHRRLIDLPGTFGGSGVFQKGWLTPRQVARAGYGSLVVGAALGLPAILGQPQLALAAAVVGGVGVLAYSSGPFGFKYHALGDLLVFVMCGPALTIGMSLVSFGTWDVSTIGLGAVFGLLAMGILHANNLQDIPVDAKRGANTLPAVLGFSVARWGLPLMYILAVASLAATIVLGGVLWTSLLALLVLPKMISLSMRSIRASGPHSVELGGMRVETAQLHLLFGVLMSIGLGLGGWFYG
jgi:1,4-dihydroxy-2-naphthoate octaprenyltransferase